MESIYLAMLILITENQKSQNLSSWVFFTQPGFYQKNLVKPPKPNKTPGWAFFKKMGFGVRVWKGFLGHVTGLALVTRSGHVMGQGVAFSVVSRVTVSGF